MVLPCPSSTSPSPSLPLLSSYHPISPFSLLLFHSSSFSSFTPLQISFPAPAKFQRFFLPLSIFLLVRRPLPLFSTMPSLSFPSASSQFSPTGVLLIGFFSGANSRRNFFVPSGNEPNKQIRCNKPCANKMASCYWRVCVSAKTFARATSSVLNNIVILIFLW